MLFTDTTFVQQRKTKNTTSDEADLEATFDADDWCCTFLATREDGRCQMDLENLFLPEISNFMGHQSHSFSLTLLFHLLITTYTVSHAFGTTTKTFCLTHYIVYTTYNMLSSTILTLLLLQYASATSNDHAAPDSCPCGWKDEETGRVYTHRILQDFSQSPDIDNLLHESKGTAKSLMDSWMIYDF